ncbi:MAG TPA: TRAP transporter small permease [archaeon]|nr:TRAP transporter small permease [archaeon]
MWTDRVVEWCATALEHVTGCVFIVLTSLTLAQVFFRYGLNSPLTWSEELVRYLCVWLTFLGASVLTAKNAHLRLGVTVMSHFSPRLGPPTGFVLDVLVFVFLILLTWQGTRFTLIAGFLTSPALRNPMWWVWIALPLNGALMLLFVGHSLFGRARGALRRG